MEGLLIGMWDGEEEAISGHVGMGRRLLVSMWGWGRGGY